jgi:hypothetical protein
MPFMGYAQEEAVKYVAYKRANIIYEFTKQQRYDVYRSDTNYPGVKKEWKPLIIDPELYKDGNIVLPLYTTDSVRRNVPVFDTDTRKKVETTIR